MRCIVRPLLVCLWLFSSLAFAEPLQDLYQVREPVASQLPEERNAGLVRALQTLVIRLTGDAQAPQNPALAGYFKDPQQLISQYGYQSGPPQVLLVDFAPMPTESALRKAGLPLWGANRPSILAWWLNEAEQTSSLVGDNQEAAAPLNWAAQRRGLPLLLPLADLEEQQLTAEQINAAQPDALRAASERYGADALLAVDAKQAEGKWQAAWRLWIGDSQNQGKVEAENPEALADAVMLAVSQQLSRRFVGKGEAHSQQLVEIEGVDLGRYAELERLMAPLNAKLVGMQANIVTYQVNVSPEQLRAQLALGQLQEVPAEQGAAPDSAAPQVLRFRW